MRPTPGLGGRDPVANRICAVMLVLNPAGEELRSHLDDAVEFPDVQSPLFPKADLDVAGRRRSNPWFLGASDGLGDYVRQYLCQAPQHELAHGAVVGHIDQGHPAILAYWPQCFGRVGT
jgi:hypothetical protein